MDCLKVYRQEVDEEVKAGGEAECEEAGGPDRALETNAWRNCTGVESGLEDHVDGAEGQVRLTGRILANAGLNDNERDERDAKDNDECDDATVTPGVLCTAPLVRLSVGLVRLTVCDIPGEQGVCR